MYKYIYIYICILYVYSRTLEFLRLICENVFYEVATISRLLKIRCLFCRISSLLWGSFAKETYDFKEPRNRSHPIGGLGYVLKEVEEAVQKMQQSNFRCVHIQQSNFKSIYIRMRIPTAS